MTTAAIQNIIALVRQSRRRVAVAVNAEITMLYWQIGNPLMQDGMTVIMVETRLIASLRITGI
jgi:hypothetical protein